MPCFGFLLQRDVYSVDDCCAGLTPDAKKTGRHLFSLSLGRSSLPNRSASAPSARLAIPFSNLPPVDIPTRQPDLIPHQIRLFFARLGCHQFRLSAQPARRPLDRPRSASATQVVGLRYWRVFRRFLPGGDFHLSTGRHLADAVKIGYNLATGFPTFFGLPVHAVWTDPLWYMAS